MLFAVVECVVGAWLRICGRVCVGACACRCRHRMFHVKQFEGGSRFGSRCGRVQGGFELGSK